MTVKIGNTEPNVFPVIEKIDARGFWPRRRSDFGDQN